MKHQPKTLAKTLDYIGFRSPGEYGLFWDPDGTMPWKEFYWALQEDPSLRFVKQSNLRELELLGLDMPFTLDGNLLRLSPGILPPRYPVAAEVPERLFLGIRARTLVVAQEFGLKPSSRSLLPLCSSRELALQMARRREPEPVLLEIYACRAIEEGLTFLAAGPQLFLAESIAAELVLFPKLRRELAERLVQSGPKAKEKPVAPSTPGSYIVQPHHIGGPVPAGAAAKKSGKGDKGEWKKGARKERHKREV
ncbi:MAG: hypothetical protein AB9866_14185 [Syntrophobacteraceae bacterium]